MCVYGVCMYVCILFLLVQFFFKLKIISESTFKEKSKKCVPSQEKPLLDQVDVFCQLPISTLASHNKYR